MLPAREEALVLRVFDFGESDRVVHLLTPRAGRLTAIAKGAKRSVKRFPGTLDVFNHLHVQLAARRRPGTMARLEQARLVEWFPGLRRDARRYALACYLLELLDRMAPEGARGSEPARLFRFALDVLQLLAAASPDARLRAFIELRALDALGLRPELSNCVRCSERIDGGGRVDFHVSEGGAVCGRCAARIPGLLSVALGTARALEQALRLELAHLERLRLPAAAASEATVLLHRFQRFHLGFELRSETFLDSVFGP